MCAGDPAAAVREGVTVPEKVFRSAKTKRVALIGYRALSDCAAKGAMFVVVLIAARRLTSEAFGIFSVASTLGWMLAVAADCGIQLHVARAIARRPSAAIAVLRRWLRVRVWTSGLVMAGVLAAIGIVRPPGSDAVAIVLLSAAYVAGGLVEFLYYFYRGFGRSELESSLAMAHRAMMLVCAAAALAWWPGVVPLAAALLAAALGALAIALRLAWRLAAAYSEPDVPRAAGQTWWAEFGADVLPIGAGIVLSALYFRIDLFLVARWLGPAAAGSYNAVFRLVEALRLFPAAVLAVALPSLVRAGDARPVTQVAAAVTLFAAVVAVACLLASSRLVPLLYGERYAGAVPAFRLLLLSFPLLSLNYALTHQLIAWNGQRSYVAICAGALVANVALNAVLIPAEGINGAAWATFWTELLLTATCAWKLWDLAPARASRVAVAAGGV